MCMDVRRGTMHCAPTRMGKISPNDFLILAVTDEREVVLCREAKDVLRHRVFHFLVPRRVPEVELHAAEFPPEAVIAEHSFQLTQVLHFLHTEEEADVA